MGGKSRYDYPWKQGRRFCQPHLGVFIFLILKVFKCSFQLGCLSEVVLSRGRRPFCRLELGLHLLVGIIIFVMFSFLFEYNLYSPLLFCIHRFLWRLLYCISSLFFLYI